MAAYYTCLGTYAHFGNFALTNNSLLGFCHGYLELGTEDRPDQGLSIG